jgi:heme-degrading monooxygenase HmoA
VGVTTGATWLRVVTYQHAPGDEDAERYMKHNIEDCLHVLEKQPGFQLGYWGRDLDEHTMAAVTYWSSREAIDDAMPTLYQLQAEAAAHGVHRVDVRNVRLFALPHHDEVALPG